MNHSITMSRILKLVPLVAAAIVGTIWFPLTARAEDPIQPSVLVSTTATHIDGSATTFVVPIMFDDGTHSIGSTSFTLDYDQSCLRINSPATDVTFVQTGLTNISTVDADNGKLHVSIYDPLPPLTALDTGELVTVRFTLETACRPSTANLTDPVAHFNFINPTFGTLLGLPVEGTATNGAYTLDINQAPTDIAAGSLAMDENTTGSRQVAELSATDADTTPADTLAFAFSGACTGTFSNQGFTLDPSDSSHLRTDLAFNYESSASYAVCLQVTDGQGGLYTERLTLVVVDKNDTPTGISLSTNTITQSADLGTTVGTFTAVDEDSSQTQTYVLLAEGAGSDDSAKFAIVGSDLKINSAVDYATQAEYRIRVQVTDSGTPPASYDAQFRVIVRGVSTLALPNVPDVPAVLGGERITVPVSFSPNGNSVLDATFHVTYSTTCLQYVGLTDLQSGFSDTDPDTNDDGVVDVSLTALGSNPLARGNPVSLVFTGTVSCPEVNAWTPLTFTSVLTLAGAGVVSFPTSKSDGQVVVLDNNARGDCNADGSIDAGDFTATVLEDLDDIESTNHTGAVPLPESWLWTPLGTSHFSAQGCDSNADRLLGSADLQCTILLFFGSTCGGAQAAASSSPAMVLIPYSVEAVSGAATSIPLVLHTQGQAVSAFAATVVFDPAALLLDPTDADGSGVPDSIHFQTPAGTLALARYDPGTGRLDLVAAGIVSPLPQLADGTLVTIDLLPAAGAAGVPAALRLENLSLGSPTGTPVAVTAGELELARGGSYVFLPTLLR